MSLLWCPLKSPLSNKMPCVGASRLQWALHNPNRPWLGHFRRQGPWANDRDCHDKRFQDCGGSTSDYTCDDTYPIHAVDIRIFLYSMLGANHTTCWTRRYACTTCPSLLFTKCCQSSKWAHSQMPSVPLEWLPPTWHRDKKTPCLVIQTKRHTYTYILITMLHVAIYSGQHGLKIWGKWFIISIHLRL